MKRWLWVFLPLSAGAGVYLAQFADGPPRALVWVMPTPHEVTILWPPWVRDHLPDALWLFSLTVALGLIWRGRRQGSLWMHLGLALALAGEALQSLGLLPGTPDIYDLVSFIAAFVAARLVLKLTLEPTPLVELT